MAAAQAPAHVDESIEDRVEAAFSAPSRDSVALIDGFIDALRTAGRDLEALRYLERGLFLRREVFGLDSPEVEGACEDLCLMCNSLAMRLLAQDRYGEALTLLKKAELLTETKGVISDQGTRVRLRAVTLNNLGCLFKARNKLHTALQYLDRALRIEANMAACDNPAGTHLNLCAILSQLGRHQAAADHARCALELLNYEAELRGSGGGGEGEGEGGEGGEGEGEGEGEGQAELGMGGLEHSGSNKALLGAPGAAGGGGQQQQQQAGRISVRAIAYYNLAVEQEHLNLADEALHSYARAVAVSRDELGPEHPMSSGMVRSLQQAKGAYRRRQREAMERRAAAQARGRGRGAGGGRGRGRGNQQQGQQGQQGAQGAQGAQGPQAQQKPRPPKQGRKRAPRASPREAVAVLGPGAGP